VRRAVAAEVRQLLRVLLVRLDRLSANSGSGRRWQIAKR
jgi:hypothetical protein